MSQYDFGSIVATTKSGTALAADLNSWRTALHSAHVGASRPSYAVGGMIWVDNVTTPWVLNIFDGAEDIPIGTVDIAGNVFRVTLTAGAGVAISANTISLNTSGLGAVATLQAADSIVFRDNSAGGEARVTIPNLFDAVADALTAMTDVDDADTVLVYDATAAGSKKATVAEFLKVINTLPNIGTGVDTASDFLLVYDATATAVKKISPNNLGGGAWVLLSSTDVSGTPAAIDLTGFDATKYDDYCIVLGNIRSSSDAQLHLRTSTDGGSTFGSSGYRYAGSGAENSSGTSTVFGYGSNTSSANQILLTNSNVGTNSNEGVSGHIFIYKPHLAMNCHIHGSFSGADGGGYPFSCTVAGHNTAAADVDAVRLLWSSGNFEDRGTVNLYGIKNN